MPKLVDNMYFRIVNDSYAKLGVQRSSCLKQIKLTVNKAYVSDIDVVSIEINPKLHDVDIDRLVSQFVRPVLIAFPGTS